MPRLLQNLLHSLFRPGVRLMHVLRFPYKFAIVGLFALGTTGCLFFLLSINVTQSIDVARREQSGLRLVQPVLILIQELQKHRGLSNGVHNGAAMAAPLAEETTRVEHALAAFDAANKQASMQLKTVKRWHDIQAGWAALNVDGPRMSAADNFTAHSALLAQLLDLAASIDEHSELLLDPEAASYDIMDAATLKLPETLELLARLRGRGTGILARQHIDESERTVFSDEVAVLRNELQETEAALQRVQSSNPALAEQVHGFIAGLRRSIEALLHDGVGEVAAARLSDDPQTYFDRTTMPIDAAYGEAQQTLLPRLNALLQQRIDRLQTQIGLGLASVAAIVLLSVYFAGAAYMAIISSVRALNDGADRIAGGEHDLHIALESKDELRSVAAHFNQMVDQLAHRTGELERSDAALTRITADYEKDRPMAMLAAMAPAIAHDLNTPIGNANLAVGTLRARLREFHQLKQDNHLQRVDLDRFLADLEKGIAIVEKAGQRAAELVTGLKHLSIDTASTRRRNFDVSQLIGEVLTTLEPTLHGRTWKIATQTPTGLTMDSYPGPLGQMLINLVQNAALHAFSGRTEGLLRISVESAAGDRIRIEVADDGVGMSPETLKRIFEPYFTTRGDSGGSGVGLGYARRLVKHTLGGFMDVESELGRGTTFVIVMARVAPQQATT